MGQIQAKKLVQRRFLIAQGVSGFIALVFAIYTQNMACVFAVATAAFVNSIQLHFMSRPSRVAKIEKWVKGMVIGIMLKYGIFSIAWVLIFHLSSEAHPQAVLMAFGAFIFTYCVPYWCSGIQLSKFEFGRFKSSVTQV